MRANGKPRVATREEVMEAIMTNPILHEPASRLVKQVEAQSQQELPGSGHAHCPAEGDADCRCGDPKACKAGCCQHGWAYGGLILARRSRSVEIGKCTLTSQPYRACAQCDAWASDRPHRPDDDVLGGRHRHPPPLNVWDPARIHRKP